ncbi:conjugal transfer protein TraG N-terminal domain-containing protein [Salinisphaera sp. T31B1]|uniref:Conjugal transfer protein TraG N-terminal domain-containing protein n=1 Tax=Salinisphaera aquimarina TaxID=2094031 RepID=A0ABV7EU03_9GAMM
MSVDLSVFDFFENVVLMLGWIVNNAIWGVLNKTMLAALPFAALILREWYTARREGEDEGNKGLLALNRIETTLYAMLLVYAFAAVPLMSVQFAPANYDQQHYEKCGIKVGTGGTSTGAGASLGGKTADIPLWWAFVHAVSNGVTNAALAALPCDTDYQYLRTELDRTAIQDPTLRSEVVRFQRWCYGRSRTQLFRKSTSLDAATAKDTDWIGSHYFLNTAGYYDSFQSHRPVKGFAYNASRDSGFGTGPSQGGYPTCKQWWSASGNGLKARLHDQIDPNLWQNIHAAFTSATADDYAIRALLNTQGGMANGNSGSDVVSGSGGGNELNSTVGTVAGAIGAGLGWLPAEGMKDVAARAMPMVQYLLMMAMVIAMPVLIVISGYSFKVAGILTFSYFGLASLTFWFGLSRWLSNNLVAMLYQSNAAKLGFMAGLTNAYDISILTLVQASMVVVLPTAWLAMLGWAGAGAGSALGGAMKQGGNETGNAGKQGGQKTQSTVSGGKL